LNWSAISGPLNCIGINCSIQWSGMMTRGRKTNSKFS
jgi:hypothetical protein